MGITDFCRPLRLDHHPGRATRDGVQRFAGPSHPARSGSNPHRDRALDLLFPSGVGVQHSAAAGFFGFKALRDKQCLRGTWAARDRMYPACSGPRPMDRGAYCRRSLICLLVAAGLSVRGTPSQAVGSRFAVSSVRANGIRMAGCFFVARLRGCLGRDDGGHHATRLRSDCSPP
jgi:hypothetical protein